MKKDPNYDPGLNMFSNDRLTDSNQISNDSIDIGKINSSKLNTIIPHSNVPIKGHSEFVNAL